MCLSALSRGYNVPHELESAFFQVSGLLKPQLLHLIVVFLKILFLVIWRGFYQLLTEEF